MALGKPLAIVVGVHHLDPGSMMATDETVSACWQIVQQCACWTRDIDLGPASESS